MDIVQLQIGDIVKGVVKDARKDHALISLGSVVAILPSTEYSWHKDCNIKKVMNVGDEISAVVVILSDKNVVLSIKRLKKNPWKEVETSYGIGQKVKGKVINVLSFGAFIELEDGLQGLLYKSEISAREDVEPSSILSENQEIEVEIISIESERKRMAFSIKYQN